MIGRGGGILGIALSDRIAVCAQLTESDKRGAVRRTATFKFSDDTSIESPEAAGAALREFLRNKSFTASRVVVGMPARWLIAMEREVPPAADEQARAMLRLQAERLAVAENGELIFDFAGQTSQATPSNVLLVGMLRQRLERVEKMMSAAGLSVMAITSTGLALASCSRQANRDGVLMLGRGGGEIVWQNGASPRTLRHVPFTMNGHGTPPLAPLGAELRRAVALAPAQISGERQLLLMDEIGLLPQQIGELSDRLGVKLHSTKALDALGLDFNAVASADPSAEDARLPGAFAPAASLALVGSRPELLPLDFKHSRLTPAPRTLVGRRGAWAIGLGAAAVIGLIALFVIVQMRQSKLNGLDAELKQLKEPTEAAQKIVDRLKTGRGYFELRPPVLDCLREITTAFRDDEKLWASSFTLRQDGKGQLVGRAADQKLVLSVLDRLKKNKRFSDVKLLDMREADTRTHEMAFSMSFGFSPVEVKEK